MQSRFVLSPNPETRGVAPRVVVATFFFLSGAIASSALYPHGGDRWWCVEECTGAREGGFG